jgi:hypothetical protein
MPGGRGFLVEARRGVVVITAAHCLPHLPPPHPASLIEERTYPELLGPLGANPTVSAECLFVDPIADVAILGEPDRELFEEENEAYHRLIDDRPTLRIGRATREPTPAWLLTLSEQWVICTVELNRWGNPVIAGRRDDGCNSEWHVGFADHLFRRPCYGPHQLWREP